MKYFGYFIATLVGFVGSYISFIFAVTGGMHFAYTIGLFLVLAHIGAFIFAYKATVRGETSLAAMGLVSPPFILYIVLFIFIVVYQVFKFVKPDSQDFVNDCQTAGVHFYKRPANPIHSVAFDWDGEFDPGIGYYKQGFKGRISEASRVLSTMRTDGRLPFSDESIEFTERKHSYRSGVYLPEFRDAPYISFTRDGKFIGKKSLTSDILVTYQFIHPDERLKADSDQGSVGYDLTVTDRRDGQKIATMRYFVDLGNGRICGTFSNDVLSEKDFLVKALDLKG